ncbi:hypothetical protein OIO90_006468 [Microbotryomycetes sp. JL221]|nr:hypothetical protein OIO90_006468 [Microbotryomycetes sp. JL221]
MTRRSGIELEIVDKSADSPAADTAKEQPIKRVVLACTECRVRKCKCDGVPDGSAAPAADNSSLFEQYLRDSNCIPSSSTSTIHGYPTPEMSDSSSSSSFPFTSPTTSSTTSALVAPSASNSARWTSPPMMSLTQHMSSWPIACSTAPVVTADSLGVYVWVPLRSDGAPTSPRPSLDPSFWPPPPQLVPKEFVQSCPWPTPPVQDVQLPSLFDEWSSRSPLDESSLLSTPPLSRHHSPIYSPTSLPLLPNVEPLESLTHDGRFTLPPIANGLIEDSWSGPATDFDVQIDRFAQVEHIQYIQGPDRSGGVCATNEDVKTWFNRQANNVVGLFEVLNPEVRCL